MELEQKCRIKKCGDYSLRSHDYLHLLYAPLIKSEACLLYELLLSLDNCPITLEKLVMLYGGHKNRFEAMRKTLEQFDLIKTYFDGIHQEWLFEVLPPLSANCFLLHDTFSRLFLNECGSKHFDWIKIHFNEQEDKDGFIDVSEHMDVTKLSAWSDKKEEMYLNLVPKEEKKEYKFDFDTFLKGADRIFPMRYRTKENLSKIADLATVHGINALDMRKYVQRSINPSTHIFDFEKVKRQVYANRTKVEPIKDPYQLSPVQFLVYKQKGAPVVESDKRLIEKLVHDYHFSNEVLNILIEYCLKQTNQQFSRAYVEKVAASWIRLDIDSKEKALAMFEQDKQKNKEKALPDWYANTDQNKPDDELLQEALSLQGKLKGDN